jgi:hypothetical protein
MQGGTTIAYLELRLGATAIRRRRIGPINDNRLDEWILELDGVRKFLAHETADRRQKHQRTEGQYTEPYGRQHDVEERQPAVGVLRVAVDLAVYAVAEAAVVGEARVAVPVVGHHLVADSLLPAKSYLDSPSNKKKNTEQPLVVLLYRRILPLGCSTAHVQIR